MPQVKPVRKSFATEPTTSGEFVDGASLWLSGIKRRDFLKLSAATLALAGLSACVRAPTEKLIPFLREPDDLVPGEPLHFATVQVIDGYAHGLLVESQMGRPVKIEGNPHHPASKGAALAVHQAYLLGLYDPHRTREIRHDGRAWSWADFEKELARLREVLDARMGEGLWILTESLSSPTFEAQMRSMRNRWPKLRWVQDSPLLPRSSRPEPVYLLNEADLVVSFDADFLGSLQFPAVYAGDFIQRRRRIDGGGSANRLVVAECGVSLTGHFATLRKAYDSRELVDFAENLRRSLRGEVSVHPLVGKIQPWIRNARDRCAFLAGPTQPARVHEICEELNREFGSKAVTLQDSPLIPMDAALGDLAQALTGNKVEGLFVIGGDPVARNPSALNLGPLISKARRSYRLSLHEDETAAHCQWRLPMAHGLETWSDARAFDGTVSLQQPLITPLFDGKSDHELIDWLAGNQTRGAHEIVHDHWEKIWPAGADEKWTEALKKGVIHDSPRAVTAKPHRKIQNGAAPAPLAEDQIEIAFRPDSRIHDGRFAQNAWLRELPDPISKISWENAALISPAFAKRHDLANGRWIRLKTDAGQIEIPVWIQPGQPEKVITLHFGFGAEFMSDSTQPQGVGITALWPAERPGFTPARFEILNRHSRIACTQEHHAMEGHEIVKTVLPRELQNAPPAKEPPVSLYPQSPQKPDERAWAMVIDLDSCTGCNACVVACQSENNIPVVGKEQVLKGREMHWIRIDRYYSGNEDDPQTHFQPVPCMQCEKAPCEVVCPVAATVHGDGGLNQMVYNRCVGTRYCSNNCPYKVRRFNFLSYTKPRSDLDRLQKNPEVSVRPRGVMEKCTYCVQRINHAQIHAQEENRQLKPREIQTACQQTCPTRAITFGDLNHPESPIRPLRANPRHYALLEELGTRPRTTYLAQIENGSEP